MKIADLWSICVQLLWDHRYVESLECIFRDNRVTTILDCGGGVGFPVIDLRTRGWEVSYVDKSAEMLGAFQLNCARHNVQIPACQVDWLVLSEVLGQQYDALLCRGNSLIYVGSWEKNSIPPNSRELIRKAIQQFYLSLSEGGLLYLDLIGSHE